MKKIIFLSLVVLIVFFIYLFNIDKKVYFLALGDSLTVGTNAFGEDIYGYTDYVKDYLDDKNKLEKYVNYAVNGYRTIDVINDINDNKVITINDEEITLKNALIKADVLTISIGSNDLLYYLSYNDNRKYIVEVINDMDKLFKLIREYCKEDIFVMGFYNPFYYMTSLNSDVKYANDLLKELTEKYNMTYIEISDELNSNKYLPNMNDIHPSKEGYKIISKKFIKEIEKHVF